MTFQKITSPMCSHGVLGFCIACFSKRDESIIVPISIPDAESKIEFNIYRSRDLEEGTIWGDECKQSQS